MSVNLNTVALTKRYGSETAIDNLNLSLESGQIVGLLGPNGSGKTTLIKMISGLLTPNSGEILVADKKIGKESKALVSYLPERCALPDWMKIGELVTMYKDFFNDFDENRAYAMLKDLDLDLKKTFKALSKGNREKVQLILCMSRNARIYCLDEPIGGVDPAARDYILKTILQNYCEDSTVIISTHLIRDIEGVIDRVLFLKKGQVILNSTVDEIREEKKMSVDALFREGFAC